MRRRLRQDEQAARRRRGANLERAFKHLFEQRVGQHVAGQPSPDNAPEFVDLEEEQSIESPEEDDDNAYNESDAALPSREGERAIEKNPSKEGGLFDEV